MIFKEKIFSEFKYVVSTPILDIRYKQWESQNNNMFYSLKKNINYALRHHFANSKISKYNINKFFTNFLIKFITKNLLFYNVDK